MSQVAFPKTFPTIQTRRLNLRELTAADAPAIYKNYADPEISKWFFDQPHTEQSQTSHLIDLLIAEFHQGRGLTWAITMLEDNQCIGTCSFGEIQLGTQAEVGFDLAIEYWGQGLMSEALRAVLAYGFSILNFSKLEAHTYTANNRAKVLLETLGFQVEKITADCHYFFLAAVG